MAMATLWKDRKPTEFLTKCGISSFKLIQTSKGRRKLVGYFENWKTTLRALDTPQVFLPEGEELKWCRHFIPNLKKAQQKKPKAKNTMNAKKSGKTGKVSDSNQPKKKDQKQSLTKALKNNNQLKKPEVQKKTKNISKNKGGNKDNKEVLAEILSLLRKLV
ncbi:hypothetical protein C1646_748371 [Rhizophagus diaphanus]|nr:hypothetical protein C1646_748371 [Rhizophagus diaphanus] [Rhizophagus sp. MUCL 43196]